MNTCHKLLHMFHVLKAFIISWNLYVVDGQDFSSSKYLRINKTKKKVIIIDRANDDDENPGHSWFSK